MTIVEQIWAAAWRAVSECRPKELTFIPAKNGCEAGWEYYDDQEMIINTIGEARAADLALAAAMRWLYTQYPELPIERALLPGGGEQWLHWDPDGNNILGRYDTLDAAVAAAVVAAGKERT